MDLVFGERSFLSVFEYWLISSYLRWLVGQHLRQRSYLVVFFIPPFMGVLRAGALAPNPGVFTSCLCCRSWTKGGNVLPRPRNCGGPGSHPVGRYPAFCPTGTLLAGVAQRVRGVFAPGGVRRFEVRGCALLQERPAPLSGPLEAVRALAEGAVHAVIGPRRRRVGGDRTAISHVDAAYGAAVFRRNVATFRLQR